MNALLRKDIHSITAYVPGKPMTALGGRRERAKIAKLNSNENALGASTKAQQAIKKNLSTIFRYPDGSSVSLKKALAKKLKRSAANMCLGNGSDEIIDIIIKTFLNRGEEIITAQMTFVEYEIIAQANGYKAITVPLKDFTYNLEAIRRRMTKKTKIVFIANPNNPTGSYVSHEELMRFIHRLPAHTLAVVDEAYLEYVDAPDFPRLLGYINTKNVIILRTFSKAYGLAGLRIGYAVARKEFIAAMEKIRQPFNVNFLAQVAAESVLCDTRFIAATRKETLQEKYNLYRALQALHVEFIPSQANFIMFKTPLDAVVLCQKMAERGILVRDLKQYGLDTYVRVTIGRSRENKLFLDNLKKILKR